MQVVEVEAVAPVSACFGRRYAASRDSCPQARRDVAEALPQFSMSDDGAFAAAVVALGPLGGESSDWRSSPLKAELGKVRREAGAPCP